MGLSRDEAIASLSLHMERAQRLLGYAKSALEEAEAAVKEANDNRANARRNLADAERAAEALAFAMAALGHNDKDN